MPQRSHRRASFETSHSSSESGSDSSSSGSEDGDRLIPDEKSHPKPLKTKRSAHSENSNKVRNVRNTSQEKENLGVKQIFEKQPKLSVDKAGVNVSSEETKKLVLKKLEILNKSNVATPRKSLDSREPPNCSPSALSDDGDTSSGGQEVRRIISNDAVARRHQANLARQQAKMEKEQERREQDRPR